MRNGQTINTRSKGENLYEVEITPKGAAEKITVYVFATNRLTAEGNMIKKRLYGKIHEIGSTAARPSWISKEREGRSKNEIHS